VRSGCAPRRADIAVAAPIRRPFPPAAIAANLGDRPHEALLLWSSAIAHAELGLRDLALARAQAAVSLLRRLGNPKADWFAHHLDNYRSAADTASLAVPSAAGAPLAPS
jgi:hypothetical protein